MKYLYGGIAIALGTGLLALLIRYEANKVRQSVEQARQKSLEETIDHAPELAVNATGRLVNRVVTATADSAATTFKPGQADSPRPATKAGTSTAPKSESAGNIDPVAVVGNIFETGRKAAKAADDFGQEAIQLDRRQAAEIGAEVHRMVLSGRKVLENASQLARVRKLAEPIIAAGKHPAMNYTFTLLDDRTVNAFSHVGGYVYVHRGLIDLAASDAELQFVLAHELGHLDLGHCERGLNYTAPLGRMTHELVGRLAGVAYHLIALGYSEDLEFDADEYAFRALIRIGRSRDETLAFSRRFLQYLRAKGMETGRRKPDSVPGAVVQEIENHFRSHPPAEDRLKRLEAIPL